MKKVFLLAMIAASVCVNAEQLEFYTGDFFQLPGYKAYPEMTSDQITFNGDQYSLFVDISKDGNDSYFVIYDTFIKANIRYNIDSDSIKLYCATSPINKITADSANNYWWSHLLTIEKIENNHIVFNMEKKREPK